MEVFLRISETLYFAPGVTFRALDLTSPALADQLCARIEGYYLTPAREAAAVGHGFAAGLLAVAAIDALSRLYFGPNRQHRRVGQDFTLFATWLLPSFRDPQAAQILYERFRNGLVHEAGLKEGAQFELGRSATLEYIGQLPVIDPARLTAEVHAALLVIASEIRHNPRTHHEVAGLLRREFQFELADAV